MTKTLGLSAEVKDGERTVSSYSHAGADRIPDVDEVWGPDLVVQVKEKFPFEWKQFRLGLKLFGYPHLAAALDISMTAA